ncbi:2-isopropylmalate synthase [Thalassoglobus polymorphus]|uniref:2-isopropylmalate synthase n=1 Tax=Thalassoglobus polymorphus TaxID=2527994 RepID=A0A517QQ71_9PLAN|nr:2-isopropylmalate synthase [Thalassoglobus polymorphus]QDT33771.1 2-isopropylmalate synthase [Thalassoglobus polymorphus]
MSDVITFFDTTLRDGEQSPGCSMDTAEKLEVAKALVDLGVDVIEAGFPIASPGDFEAVQKIAQKFGDQSTICGLARCRKEDIDSAWGALQDAQNVRIHVFLATSAIHRDFKLKMAKEEIVRRAVDMVKYTCDQMASRSDIVTPNVEFSPEDAARTELDFLCEVVEKTIAAGATTVNIPDTVGYATPNHFFKVISYLKENVSNIDQAVISTHCHNDLGLAVANSLAGIEAGARQVECTINGLGERAGNAALEELAMAIRTRGDYYGVTTNINTQKLCSTSRLVSKITGMAVQRNKAIVGQNAFAHEAGIHQHGMLQERTTYEIMRPQDVGYVGTNLVLGKHSGRHAFRDRVESLGYDLSEESFQKAFEAFIALADKKKEIFDVDIVALVDNQTSSEIEEHWKIKNFHTLSGTETIPTATLELEHKEGNIVQDAATGDGPVDAAFKCMERVAGISAKLTDYNVRSVSSGKDALGEVSLSIDIDGVIFHGKGVSTDVIEASVQAYLQALNKALSQDRGRRRNEKKGV